MATAAPQGPTPGPTQPPPDGSPAAQPLSWEGDKMFNIYIYDYCFKRGFRKTARELLLEAEIPNDSTPPINARQGLLFEWWSVFWVLFTAKANGQGSEEALLYTQHQAHQSALKTRAAQQQPMPMGGQLMPQQQPPMARGPNGIGPPQGFAPNRPIPNGIPPGNGQPPGPTAFAGPPMPNGIMSGPPPPGQPGFMPGRPPLTGQPRPMNGGPPFQSPTMAHSPPNAGQPPQPGHGQPQHPQPPMGQLGPPGRGSMLPPGPQGMNPGHQTPTPYPPVPEHPPNRTSTPQAGMVPSPSMPPRQPPGPSMVPGAGSDPRQELNMAAELQAIPIPVMSIIKSELGIGDKPLQALTVHEKQRIIMMHRQRPKPGALGATNAAAGPSTMPAPPRRPNKRNSTSPGEDPQPDDIARNPSSPKRPRRSPAEGGMTNPPGYPNQTPQPPTQPGAPVAPGGPAGTTVPQQQPPMGNNMMGRPMGGPMNGFPSQGQPNMQQQMSGPMSMMGINPMMGNVMPPNAMGTSMSPQMHTQGMYRQNLQTLNRMPGAMNAASPGTEPTFNPGMPMAPGGPQQQPPQLPGGPGPGGQPQQFASRLSGPPNTKPMSMLPPPSPAKDQNAVNKDIKPANGIPEGSPRPQSITGPNSGTAPPTPGSSQGGPGAAQPGSTSMAPSPGLMMNPNPTTMNPVAMPLPPAPSSTGDLFSTDFINNVANGLDEFDVGLFRGDGDINFERDFGQWFNPDDMTGSMELGKQ